MRYSWDFCGGLYSLQERLAKHRTRIENGIQSVQLRLYTLDVQEKKKGFLSLAKKKRKKLNGDNAPVYNRTEDC